MILIITIKTNGNSCFRFYSRPQTNSVLLYLWFPYGLISRGFLEVIPLIMPSILVRVSCVLYIEYPVHL
jgi:hypothetical protein